jgi:hypothetical protein
VPALVTASALPEQGSEVFQSGAVLAPAAPVLAPVLNSTGGGIYVFHSKAILATKKPTESEKSSLQQSIALATKGLRQPIVVLDADALSIEGMPFVLFAEARFDLTEVIKRNYSSLNDAPTSGGVVEKQQ